MPRRLTVSVAVTMLLLVAHAGAQQPGRGPGRGMFSWRGLSDSLAFLVAVPEVQEELRVVSEEQKKLLAALQEDLRDQMRRIANGSGGGRSRPEEIRDKFDALRKQGDELVAIVLEPEQAERLNQIRVQREGIRALDRPEFAQALELSDSQLAKIRDIRVANSARSAASQPGSAGREKLEREILSVLTAQQKQEWNTMKGAEFAFPERFSRFGPRSRGRRGGRGRGPRPQ